MIGQQVRLLNPWARYFTGLPLRLSGCTGTNRWQLDSQTAKGHLAVSWQKQLGK